MHRDGTREGSECEGSTATVDSRAHVQHGSSEPCTFEATLERICSMTDAELDAEIDSDRRQREQKAMAKEDVLAGRHNDCKMTEGGQHNESVFGSNGILAKIGRAMRDQRIELTTLGLVVTTDGAMDVKSRIGSVVFSQDEMKALVEWYGSVASSVGVEKFFAIHVFNSSFGGTQPIFMQCISDSDDADSLCNTGKGSSKGKCGNDAIRYRLRRKRPPRHEVAPSFTIEDITLMSTAYPIETMEVVHDVTEGQIYPMPDASTFRTYDGDRLQMPRSSQSRSSGSDSHNATSMHWPQ